MNTSVLEGQDREKSINSNELSFDSLEFNDYLTTDFNRAIREILIKGNRILNPLGFVIESQPGPQEDSGDTVSSESVVIEFINQEKMLRLRFFFCCGKRTAPDFISAKLIPFIDPFLSFDFSEYILKTGLPLSQLDFNTDKKSLPHFLEIYFDEFAVYFQNWIEAVEAKIGGLDGAPSVSSFRINDLTER